MLTILILPYGRAKVQNFLILLLNPHITPNTQKGYTQIIAGAGAGLLVDPQNHDAISDAMKWILDNPKQAKRMGENGKRAVEKEYNWNIESKKLIAMYHDLIIVEKNTSSQVE